MKLSSSFVDVFGFRTSLLDVSINSWFWQLFPATEREDSCALCWQECRQVGGLVRTRSRVSSKDPPQAEGSSAHAWLLPSAQSAQWQHSSAPNLFRRESPTDRDQRRWNLFSSCCESFDGLDKNTICHLFLPRPFFYSTANNENLALEKYPIITPL